MIKNLPFLLVIFFICGCSSSKKTIIADSLDATPVITGSVVDPSVLEKGGSLALGSFKPGPGAVADDETDQLSSLILKGIKDAWPGDSSRFSLQSDGQNNSDFYLEGYIEDYDRKGHFSHLSVDGEIYSRDTGDKILLFQTAIRIDLRSQDPKMVAYQIGAAISHFIGRPS